MSSVEATGSPDPSSRSGSPRGGRGGGLRRFGYASALFASSAGGLIVEIVAGRMIAPYVGMSLYTWTAIIAVVLAGFALGHWIGGHMAQGDRFRCRWRVACLAGLAAVSVMACLPLIRVVAPAALSLGLHPISSIVLLTSGLFLLPSLFVGTISPILTKLAVEELPEAMGRAIGQMFAAGALGSIAGTLAAGYLFISWIGSSGTVLSVTAGYLVIAAGFALASRASPRHLAATAAALAAVIAGLVAFGIRAQAFESPCRVESDYYCIQVIDFSGETGRASALMVLDHLGHGINDRDDPTKLYSSYLALTDRLLRERLGGSTRFSAFFIGGGANTLPRAWSVGYPQAELLVSEIDPAVTRAAREAMWFEPGSNLAIDHRDSRLVLRSLPEHQVFDVIVGDAFHDISVPQHLTTLEFARLLAARLSADGFYALNVVDSGRLPLFLYSIVRTLGQAFASVEVWVDADQLGSGGRITYLVVAAQRPSGHSDLRSLDPEGPHWLRWPDRDLETQIEAAGVPLLTDDFAPVDRLMLHVLAEEP